MAAPFPRYDSTPLKHIEGTEELIHRHPELENACIYIMHRVIIADGIVIESCDVYRNSVHYGSIDNEGLGWKFHRDCHANTDDLKDFLREDISEVLDSILELGDYKP